MPQGLTENTKKNLAKILYVIKGAPGVHLRGMARTLNMHPFTIATLVQRYLKYFVDIKEDPYGSKLKAYSLKSGKENSTLEDVLRYYEVKKRISRSGSP